MMWTIKINGRTAYVAEPYLDPTLLSDVKFFMQTKQRNELVIALPDQALVFDSSDVIHQALASLQYFIFLVDDPKVEVTLTVQDLNLPVAVRTLPNTVN